MNEAMQGLIQEIELRLTHLRTLAEMQGNVNDKNAELLRQVARLQAENKSLRQRINAGEAHHFYGVA